MSVTKLSTKDFQREVCNRCKREYTRAMMIQVVPNHFKCVVCFNGGKIDPYLIKTKKILKGRK